MPRRKTTWRAARITFAVQHSIDMEGGPDRDFASIVQAEATVQVSLSARKFPRDDEPAAVIAAFLVRPFRAGQHGILDECAEVGGESLRRVVDALWDAGEWRLRPDILHAFAGELAEPGMDPALLAIDPIIVRPSHRGEALGLRAVRCISEAFGGAACLVAGIVRPTVGDALEKLVASDFGAGADGQADALRAYWERLGTVRQAARDPAVCWLMRLQPFPAPRPEPAPPRRQAKAAQAAGGAP
jgi:hypothetical protein